MKYEKKKAVIMIIILISVVFLFYQSDLYRQFFPTAPTPIPVPIKPPFVKEYEKLRVFAETARGRWARDSKTDLPIYNVVIIYTVFNEGKASADNVALIAKMDGGKLLERDLPAINAGDSIKDQLTVSVYDGSYTIRITATSTNSEHTHNLLLNAAFPRSLSQMAASIPEVIKLYVTPNDPDVKVAVNEIMRGRPLIKWKAIRDWVGDHIQYRFDNFTYGTGEYWQLPRETLQSGVGDCEDQAILLASMLRASNWKTDQVYVVVGDGHAWVSLKVTEILGKEVWFNLEPTAGGGWGKELVADIYSSIKEWGGGTTRWEIFNDLEFRWVKK